MMLFAETAAAHRPQIAESQAQARAGVRVLNGTKAGRSVWETGGNARKRQIIRTDPSGRRIVIRVIENE